MGYQENRAKRIEIFEDTIRYCERNSKLLDTIDRTRQNTVLYKVPLKECGGTEKRLYGQPVKVSVSLRRTVEAAKLLRSEHKEGRVGILNFASATSPGGGVIRGSNAQEESICRCSTLYPCLNTSILQKEYYNFHRKQRNPFYTDACIVTPGITVFKTDDEWPEICEETQWFLMDVISCAAPNLRMRTSAIRDYADRDAAFVTDGQLKELLQNRIRGIFQVAVKSNIEILVLGAFGCGAFCNSPYMMAEVFKETLKEYMYSFREIEFAIYCEPADRKNYDIFSKIITEESIKGIIP